MSFKGTYLREPDGAARVMHSPHLYRDASSAYRVRPSDWSPVRADSIPPRLWSELEWLAPGEYLESDGALVIVGG